MKKMTIILLGMLLISVGCSNSSSPVAISDKATATLELQIKLEKIGVGGLLKEMAKKEDSLIVLLGSGLNETGPVIRRDTIVITGLDDVKTQYTNMTKYGDYWIRAWRTDGIFDVNNGKMSFTVPDKDTFRLSVNLPANATQMNTAINLSGTSGVGICTVTVTRTLVPSGASSPFSLPETKILSAGESSVVFSGYLGVNYAWDIEVRVAYLNIYYIGKIRTPVLIGGNNYTLDPLVLTSHDQTKSIVVASISIGNVGSLSLPVRLQ